jgi:hypothetical protein
LGAFFWLLPSAIRLNSLMPKGSRNPALSTAIFVESLFPRAAGALNASRDQPPGSKGELRRD